MLCFFVGFLAGSMTFYLYYRPERPLAIWIQLTNLSRKYVVFNIKKHAPSTNDSEAAGSCKAESEEGPCQMETDGTQSKSSSDAGSRSETQEAVLSWTAELFEPVQQRD
jgi:hypothetical protein